MRSGDFGLEVMPVHGDDVRETDSGHVLARPGAVYALRLRNFGPLRCVVEVHIDGKLVTAGGLVLDPYSVTTLERPVDDTERGRFTIIAEGDERVFGPDGGRDNPDLGLIEASFRRELPSSSERSPRALPDVPWVPLPEVHEPRGPYPGRPMAPPEWTPPEINNHLDSLSDDLEVSYSPPSLGGDDNFIERAAGTGLTGYSSQDFFPVTIGALESEATVLRLRLVIGTEEAFAAPRPLPADATPARPAARP